MCCMYICTYKAIVYIIRLHVIYYLSSVYSLYCILGMNPMDNLMLRDLRVEVDRRERKSPSLKLILRN